MDHQHFSSLKLFVRHKLLANLVILLLLILGAWSVLQIRTQIIPSFALNIVNVSTIWPGASATNIAESILKPIENEVLSIDNLKNVSGRATKGLASITIELNPEQDIDEVLQEVKDKVSSINDLPADAEAPVTRKMTLYEDILQLLITSTTLEKAGQYAREFKEELAQIGIPRIDIFGLPKREVEITFSPLTLERLKIDLPSLAQQIKSRNQSNLALGSVIAQGVDKLLVVNSVGDEISALMETPINIHGQTYPLHTMADIKLVTDPDSSTVSYHGDAAINMIIYRLSTTSALKAAMLTHEWIQKKQQALSSDTSITVAFEGWTYLKARIMLLVENGIGGLILVIALLYLFLPPRVGLWVAVGIPVSVAGALIIMKVSGLTINLLSLFGLIMSLGVVVDDNIVVAENAVTIFNQTGKAEYAATQAVKNMFIPVCSSAITTIAAFMPLLLVGGIYGDVMRDVPLVMIFVVFCSVFECFFILPHHLYLAFSKTKNVANLKKPPLNQVFLDFRDCYFRPFINLCLTKRLWVVFGLFVFIGVAVNLVVKQQVKFEFFPSPDFNFMTADVKFAAGTPVHEMHAELDKIAKTMTQTQQVLKAQNEGKDYIRHIVVKLKTDAIGMRQSNEIGSIIVETTDPDQRKVSNAEILNLWRANAYKLNLNQIQSMSFEQPKPGPPGSDLQLKVTGPKQAAVEATVKAFEAQLAVETGILSINDNLIYGPKEYAIELLPHAVKQGVDRMHIMQQIKASMSGIEIKDYYIGNEKIPVKVILPERYADDAHLLDIPLKVSPNTMAPLETVVKISPQTAARQINTYDGEFAANINIDVDSKVLLAPELSEKLKDEIIPNLESTYNTQFKFTGAERDQKQVIADMLFGLVIGLSMIYVILAVISESTVWPVWVMLIIPLAVVGTIYGHWLLGKNISLLSLFGMFGLGGIVVNDSIILLLRYKELIHRHKSKTEAMKNAVCDRLRPVFLTSITTMAALTPLLFETSIQAQFLIPMAITLIFGLFFATVLILIVLPVFISFSEK